MDSPGILHTTEKSSPTEQLVYGRRPWLVPGEAPFLVKFFEENGEEILLRHGESLPLGRKNTLYLIEEGLIASVPLYQGGTSRLCGLFGPKTVLGLVMALRDSGGNHHSMALSARALTNTRALCISCFTFSEWFDQQPLSSKEEIYRNAISKTESQLEGVFVNDLYPVAERLLWALAVLSDPQLDSASGEKTQDGWHTLASGITLSDIANLTHANREMVSRAFAEFQREGIVMRFGRRLRLKRGLVLERIKSATTVKETI